MGESKADKLLKEIKTNLLQQKIAQSYVVSAYEVDVYDFPRLCRDLQAHLRHFNENRPPGLSCGVCRSEEDLEHNVMHYCRFCRFLMCESCSHEAANCTRCGKAEPYKRVGEQLEMQLDESSDVEASVGAEDSAGEEDNQPRSLVSEIEAGDYFESEGERSKEAIENEYIFVRS